MKFVVAAAAALLAMPAVAGANLVVNGDFSAGNSGFTSAYAYVPSPGPTAMYPQATYAIGPNANQYHNLWADVPGRGGAGNYMIVNGAVTSGLTVWQSAPIAVDANRTYDFRAFAANICCASGGDVGSDLMLQVIGDVTGPQTVGTLSTGATGVWIGGGGLWSSGDNMSVTLRVVNGSLAAGGNDLGLDDIAFGVVPEPATWAMMIMGFGLVGMAARRRPGRAAA